MFFSYRLPNNNYSTFNPTEKKEIKTFEKFTLRKPDGFCCVCMKKLYHEEKKYREFENIENLPCLKWNLQPLSKPSFENMKMVCSTHLKMDESKFKDMVYPGKNSIKKQFLVFLLTDNNY